jgi:hypothetical protein
MLCDYIFILQRKTTYTTNTIYRTLSKLGITRRENCHVAKITNHSRERKEAMWEEGFKTKIILTQFPTGFHNVQAPFNNGQLYTL